jgi:hypothetical protein
MRTLLPLNVTSRADCVESSDSARQPPARYAKRLGVRGLGNSTPGRVFCGWRV